MTLAQLIVYSILPLSALAVLAFAYLDRKYRPERASTSAYKGPKG
ncbi:hypothetical protein [Jiella endophytica]|nr:hypothetical protein [Jiella endophytica]